MIATVFIHGMEFTSFDSVQDERSWNINDRRNPSIVLKPCTKPQQSLNSYKAKKQKAKKELTRALLEVES